MTREFERAAYGGEGWSPRVRSLREEIGDLWAPCGIDSEWRRLQRVLLHRPGPELETASDANAALMITPPDSGRVREEHDALAEAYRELGVAVHYVEPDSPTTPNQVFVADLMFMTPEGAIVGRPASTVRAGEERWAASALARSGVPILRTVSGEGTFEGADAAWLDPETVMIGRGPRTNDEGAWQVATALDELGVEVIEAQLPSGTMHLMGQLRFLDRDLAVGWPTRLSAVAVEALRDLGYEVLFLPDEDEALHSFALNFVTVGPREIVMPGRNPVTQAFYEEAGVTCHTVEISELGKAAGSIGCATGVVEREMERNP